MPQSSPTPTETLPTATPTPTGSPTPTPQVPMVTPPEGSPKTGDPIEDAGYVRLLLIAFSAVCVILFVRRRARNINGSGFDETA